MSAFERLKQIMEELLAARAAMHVTGIVPDESKYQPELEDCWWQMTEQEQNEAEKLYGKSA